MSKSKFYVVWSGYETGIFDNWSVCEKQVKGYPNAKYKSFANYQLAESAFNNPDQITEVKDEPKNIPDNTPVLKPILESISVDGACNATNGTFEYQGVCTLTGKILFRKGPFLHGSNNIAEFLAIVDAIKYCLSNNINTPIYSDSQTALTWIKNKAIKTTVAINDDSKPVFDMIEAAISFLNSCNSDFNLLKWETRLWGEIKADFGRK